MLGTVFNSLLFFNLILPLAHVYLCTHMHSFAHTYYVMKFTLFTNLVINQYFDDKPHSKSNQLQCI